jgi:hypothetical protein
MAISTIRSVPRLTPVVSRSIKASGFLSCSIGISNFLFIRAGKVNGLNRYKNEIDRCKLCDTKITSYLYNFEHPAAALTSRYPQNPVNFLSLLPQNNMSFYTLNSQNIPEK